MNSPTSNSNPESENIRKSEYSEVAAKPKDLETQVARESEAFTLFHPSIQKWIWEQGWDEIRDAQEQAASPILSTKRDVIISAATASGKTEAAFLSICTVLLNQREKSASTPHSSPVSPSLVASSGIKVLYLSPLKALINDQFNRLDAFCERLEIPVHRWHGDVGATHKKRAVEMADGILLITPESLEAMFVNRGSSIHSLFAGLNYIVIDELHAFLGSERGAQLQSLMHRIEKVAGRKIPRVGLSATLGNMSMAADFLRPAGGNAVAVVISQEQAPSINLQLRGYENLLDPTVGNVSDAPKENSVSNAWKSYNEEFNKPAEEVHSTEDDNPTQHTIPEIEDEAETDEDQIVNGTAELEIAKDLFRVLRNSDNLVFANSRKKVERYADLLSRMCEEARVPNTFMPHHGNLDKSIREEVESKLKDRSVPLTAVCTSTLELGIDIGSVASVAQIGSPPSVSSLRQRLGRSGRRGSPATLRLYITETELASDSPLYAQLRVQLVQSIAMVNLLMNRFNESPNAGGLHLSTLIQQLLSLIAQYSGVSATQAYNVLCGSPEAPFNQVLKEEFIELLRQLGKSPESKADYIMQSSDGLLILGTVGERIVNHYSFYTAFSTPEEYRLIANGRQIGTYPVEQMILVDSLMIFAGRRWRVLSVDEDKKVIELKKARGGKLPDFGGEEIPVSLEVRKEMWRIYNDNDVPAYLNDKARDLLREARRNFRLYKLHQEKVVESGEDILLFGWVGDLELSTLAVMLTNAGVKVSKEGIYLNVREAGRGQVDALLFAIATGEPIAPEDLAMFAENKVDEKYDHLLSERLLNLEYAKKNIRVSGAIALARDLLDMPVAPVVELPSE